VFRFDDEDQLNPIGELTGVQRTAFEAPDHGPLPPGPFIPDEEVAELPRHEPLRSWEQPDGAPSREKAASHRAIRGAGTSRITAASTWPGSSPPANDFDAGTMLAGMVRGSLLVAALLGTTLWAVRWWMKNKSGAFVGRGGLNVISSLALAGRCHLQLVDARGHQVLIGIDAGGIKCVTVLPERFETSFDEASHAFDRPDAEPAEPV
jgi:flagellar biogenesis protein FliO